MLLASACADTPGWFPFVIPWNDEVAPAIDVSFLNPAPLEDKHRVRVIGSHFTDATGRRVRFFGVNFTYQASFMNKEDAPIVASRLHKFGVNIVRLHHMDMLRSPNGIWLAGSTDTQTLDPDQLDRLDYLIYQLKQHGIYIDLNLYVSRPFSDGDGLPETAKLPWASKNAAIFEPRMIELQKQYARALLDRFNPYTKLRYADDPAIALIEINNEDTLLGPARAQTLRTLPSHYRDILAKGWNQFLRDKYRDTPTMLAAWNRGTIGHGPNLISNSRFEESGVGWQLTSPSPVQAGLAYEVAEGDDVPPGRAVRIRIANPAVKGPTPALRSDTFMLPASAPMRLTFWARSSIPERPLRIQIVREGDLPESEKTLREQTVKVAKRWQPFVLAFPSGWASAGQTRLQFLLPGLPPGEVFITNVELRRGNAVELPAGQTVETANIELPLVSFTGNGTRQEADYYEYLMQVERRYVDEMTAFIKDTLGAKAPLTCSQAGWGGIGGVIREARTDFVDMHGYWQHPDFPYADWNDKNWRMDNTPMVRDENGGTLAPLAMHRVEGKPYTVTEYSHAAPNDFAAESVPALAAYAASQDWDGILFFQYGQNRGKWKFNRIDGWWNIYSNPSKWAYFPAAALLFLGDQFPVTPGSAELDVSPVDAPALLARYGAGMPPLWQSQGGYRVSNFMDHRAGIRLADNSGLRLQENSSAPKPPAIGWQPQKGFFQAASPGSRILLGNWKGKWQGADGFRAKVEGALPVALTLSSRDGRAIRDSGELLLTAGSRFENLNMGWNADRTTVGNQWGEGPVQAQGVSAQIELETNASSVTIFALDASGARLAEAPSRLANGKVKFRIDASYKAVWYQIVAKQGK